MTLSENKTNIDLDHTLTTIVWTKLYTLGRTCSAG